MSNNPQTPRIILFDRKEQVVSYGKQYLVITDHSGQETKISEKRQSLWGLFDKAFKNEAFIVIYETYNSIEYVADVQRISDALLQRGIQEIALKLGDQQTEERNRSTSLSYAKDMLVADKINKDELFNQAHDNYIFIKTGKVNLKEEA